MGNPRGAESGVSAKACGLGGVSEWPLVGRAAELARVDELLLRRASGVVLAGPAGVGKTRLAGECLGLAAQQGYAPLRVGATQAAATLPFGAFAGLLPELAGGTDRGQVLRQVRRSIINRGNGMPVALLVDDAHLLDEASAALAHQLAAADEAFVLATVRSGEPASDAVVALWKDGVAERVDLTALTADHVDALLAKVLGGPAEGSTVRVLCERTEGNPLFLKELVVAACEVGVLRDDGGVWRLHGSLPTSSRLIELVEARLGGLSEADRGALELLAVWEPMGVEPFERLSGEVGVEPLEKRRLIRIDADGRRLKVRLVHPLYGDVLRARLSPLRTRAVSRSLAAAVEANGARRREDVLRVGTWRLDGGGEVRPDLMLAAAEDARQRYDFVLAERLARAAVEAGAGFDAAFLAAQACFFQGRMVEAEADLAVLATQTTDDAERGLVAATRMDNLGVGLDFEEALRVGEEAERELTDRRWLHEIAARRANILLRTEGPQAAVEATKPVRREGEGRAYVWACTVAILGLARLGRLGASVETAELGHAAYQALSGPPLPLPPEVLAAMRSEALREAGRLDEAETVLTDAYQTALADGATEVQAHVGWQLAKVLMARGRVGTAARYMREAVALFRPLGRLHVLAYSLPALVGALALGGQVEEATAALIELDGIGMSPRHLFAVEALQARAWTAVAGGDLPGARELLEEGAALGRSTGDLVGRSAALHDLARLGCANEVAADLAAVAAEIEGDFAPARARHAAALAKRDPAALEQCSCAFAAMGADLLAAEAAADAAVAWRRAGDPRKAAAAERRAHALADRCEGARTPALTAIAARATLSARELEIARLAASGVPNKEIAERLYLSLHTVQNKLHAAYEKLGVEGRAELADALDGYS